MNEQTRQKAIQAIASAMTLFEADDAHEVIAAIESAGLQIVEAEKPLTGATILTALQAGKNPLCVSLLKRLSLHDMDVIASAMRERSDG